MVDHLRQKAIEGPWATSERLLARVGPDEVSERVVRRASQPDNRPQRRLDRRDGRDHRRGWRRQACEPARQVFGLAERLGGQTMRLQGATFRVKSSGSWRAKRHSIVLGQSRAGLLRRSQAVAAGGADALCRGRDIYIVPARGTSASVVAASKPPLSRRGAADPNCRRARFGVAVLSRSPTRSAVPQASRPVDDLLTVVLFSRFRVRDPRRSLCLACFVRRGISSASSRSTRYGSVQPRNRSRYSSSLAVAVLTGSLTGRVRDQRETVIWER